MAERPFSPELQKRFFKGDASRREAADMVRALLLQPLGEEPQSPEAAGDEAALNEVFERSLRKIPAQEETFLKERRLAEELARELTAKLATRSFDELLEEIRNDDRYHNWSLSEALRLGSFDTGLDDPELAVSLARLSLAAAEHAMGGRSDSRLDHDLLASVWGQLGNAYRIASDLRGSEMAFTRARDHLSRGTGDPFPHAQLLSFEVSLASDRGRYPEGIARCRKATRLYRSVGDRHGQGRMLIQEANLHVNKGDLPTAIRCLDQAAERVDLAQEPRLLLVAQHNLISYLDQQNRHDEARERLEPARQLARRVGHRLDLVRLRWLEGRIALHRGETALAETCWNEARAAFVELGVAFDAALVSLELAGLLEHEGRRAELCRLVEAMLPIFRSQSLHREAQAALKIFGDAVRDETAEIEELAQKVGRYLEQARNRPELPFRH